jgi:hypothetical protein
VNGKGYKVFLLAPLLSLSLGGVLATPSEKSHGSASSPRYLCITNDRYSLSVGARSTVCATWGRSFLWRWRPRAMPAVVGVAA